MSEKKWPAKVHIRTNRENESTLVLEVDISKRKPVQNISELTVNIDHYVVFYQLIQQVLGYYHQTIDIEPYGKEEQA